VESLLREVKGWQNTSQLPLSEDSLKSTSSTGPDDLPKDFEDEYKHAVGTHSLFTLRWRGDLICIKMSLFL
jgi:hypothetical protein